MMMNRIFNHILSTPYKSIQLLSKRSYDKNTLVIRRGTLGDASDILDLYKKVASIYPDRLTQQVDELTLTYIQNTLRQACLRGLVLVMFENDKLLSYIKGYTSEFRRQAHVLANGTLMIEPTAIGQRHAYKLYQMYRKEIETSMRHIRLVEAVPHCSSIPAIQVNETVGFVRQASLPNKIRYTDGTFGSEIVMHWTNPNFCEQSLLRYHKYLRTLIKETPSSSLKH